MQKLLRHIALAFVLFHCLTAQAGERIDYDQFRVYADTADLSFEALSRLEAKGEIQFGDYSGLSSDINIYWIKIDSTVLGESEYLFFSNYFDRLEAYYLGDTASFSIAGRFVEFEDRAYKKGFYCHVLSLKRGGHSIYIKLISISGNSIFNRSLSHIELSTAPDLENQSNRIFTTFTLLTGMELVILMVNLFLIYLKPSKTGVSYALFIIVGILLSNFTAQVFVDSLGLSAITISYLELIFAVLLIYSFNLFSVYFLNAKKYSKVIHYALIFPYFPLVIMTMFITNGYYFPLVSQSYFIVILIIILYLVIAFWKGNSNRKIFIFANGLSIISALVTILALNGFITHHFMTTNAVFLGFILRDTIFTVDLMKEYFKLEISSMVRKAAIIKLTEEKEQLKKIEKLKTVFFNNVSHELRTPLTLILSPLESTLKSGKIPEELRKDLNLSLKNGKYLLQLVNEMLDLAKLDKGELEIMRQPTDVVQIIKNIREKFQAYAKEKNQRIFISNASESIMARVDQDKFEKVIINLVSNAIKYSDKSGSIFVKIDEQGDTLDIQVSDEGRGISQKEISKIFDRYFQSENNDEVEGTGIGLSIVKEFMDLHKGTVDCSSSIGKGTTFRLSFPKAIHNTDSVDINIDEDNIVIDQAKFTLLIVEDHADMRTYLKDNLSAYNVLDTADGKSALQKMEDGLLPDLILTDYMMPNMNGYEMAQQIKAQDSWTHIPIIFLTARTLSADKVKVLNLGVDDYIVKPFNLEELKVRITHILKTVVQRKEVAKESQLDLPIVKQKSFKTDLDNYILENLKNTKLANTDLAYHFMLSDRNLYRRVKLVSGQSPAAYIREVRLQKARMLLESQGEMSIAEVAYESGMDNLSHFSQAFKKRFGKLPSSIE